MDSVTIGNRIKALMAIRELKRSYIAKKLGISYNTLTKKLNGQREFSVSEIIKIKEIFDLDEDLCANIFFNPNFLLSRDKRAN